MSLDEEYPKTYRNNTAQLRALLERDTELSPDDRVEIASTLSNMADLACDLNDIVQRLLDESHTSAEIGELLIAFELTTEQIRGYSDVIDGKLYEIGDRLNGVRPAEQSDE